MSDTPNGPDWWIASDGKWYPPQGASAAPEAEPPPPAPEPSGVAWWKRPVPLWAVVIIALLALGLGAAVADPDSDDEAAADESGDLSGEDEDGEVPTTTATERSTTTRPTTTTEATTTTTAPTTTTTTAPPRPGFGGGTQVVGTDFEPGLYMAADIGSCYWERLSGLSGEFGDIIANNNTSGQALVEIAASDVAFNSQRCGRWELYEPPPAPVDSFGEGDWVVGEQIQPGRYRAEVDSSCYWERASGFGHDFGDIIANDNVSDGNAIVEIAPTDRRFTSTRCGTWTLMS